MKFYITKFALTKGILLRECTLGSWDPKWALYKEPNKANVAVKVELEAFERYEDALAKADFMRVVSMARLRDKIERLRNLKFTRPTKEVK